MERRRISDAVSRHCTADPGRSSARDGLGVAERAAVVDADRVVPDSALPPGWSVFAQAPSALALADAEGRILAVNRALCDLVGISSGELLGTSAYAHMRLEEREAARERLGRLKEDGKAYAVDQCFEPADGHPIWLQVHVGVVDDAGERFLMAQIEDTTDHRRTTQRLRRLAERDHLTGLLNRRRVEEELEEVLAGVRRHGHRAALVLVDLDHFKAVNDREGHEAGDRVLSFVAATLATRVREEDAVGRLGGDEFAVILRDATLEAAEVVASELVALIAGSGYTRDRGVTMSAGVAALTSETRNAQDALHAADLAMYAAKEAGRDQVAVHGPSSGAAGGASSARSITLKAGTAAPASARELLGGLQAVAEAPSIEHALQAVRDLLGMDVSYVSRHTESQQTIVVADGEPNGTGIEAGVQVKLSDTLCRRILDGELPAAMADVGAYPEAAALVASRIGAYASVPILLSDGTLYGTLCAASHERMVELGERDLQFLAVLARVVAGELEHDAALRAQLELRVQAAGAEALLSAVEARDRYTGAHSREVVELALAVATELGLPEAERHEVAQVALLHDIGKLALPDAILSKPGPLTHDEIVQMRKHPEDGERIVAAIPDLSHLSPAIRAEHERWDGGGYPDGLAGEHIPIASRIVFVCDAWDAMTSDRPYRARMSRDEALAELAVGADTQFCGRCVQGLFTVLARG